MHKTSIILILLLLVLVLLIFIVLVLETLARYLLSEIKSMSTILNWGKKHGMHQDL